NAANLHELVLGPMAHGVKFANRGFGDGSLESHAAGPPVTESRRTESRLYVHVKEENVQQDLDMGLRLLRPADNAIGKPGLLCPIRRGTRDKPRDDRMERSSSWSNHIGLAFFS